MPSSKGRTLSQYQAPKPLQVKRARILAVVKRIVFPLILVWDMLQWIANKLFGSAVGRLVLAAQGKEFTKDQENFENYYTAQIAKAKLNASCVSAEELTVATHDGALLNTFEINYQHVSVPPSEKKYIINFVGNCQCYENIVDAMEKDARQLKCTSIGFNHRGVSRSSGRPRSSQDLVTDGIAQVQRLLDKNIDAENITLKGFSLGGGIAVLVAKYFHDHGLKVNVYNDRSFSSITNVVVGFIRTFSSDRLFSLDVPTGNGHIEPWGMKLVAWFFKPLIKLLVTLVGWEIDAARAFKTLPNSHKEHSVIRSPKTMRAKHKDALSDDATITHYASLHATLKDERRAKKAKIDAALLLAHKKSKVAVSDDEQEPLLLEETIRKLTVKRLEFKKNKMFTHSDKISTNAHCLPLNELYYQSGVPGSAPVPAKNFFYAFVERAHAHHVETKMHTQRDVNEKCYSGYR